MAIPAWDNAPEAGVTVRIVTGEPEVTIAPGMRERDSVFRLADGHERGERFGSSRIREPQRLFRELDGLDLDDGTVIVRDERGADCPDLDKLRDPPRANHEVRRIVVLKNRQSAVPIDLSCVQDAGAWRVKIDRDAEMRAWDMLDDEPPALVEPRLDRVHAGQPAAATCAVVVIAPDAISASMFVVRVLIVPIVAAPLASAAVASLLT